MKTIILLATIAMASADVCKVFRCSQVANAENECIVHRTIVKKDTEIVTDNLWEIDVTKCTEGKVCLKANLEIQANATCIEKPVLTPFTGLDGDACTKTEECWSGVCTEKLCVGVADKSVCTDDKVCKKGSYCKSVTTEGVTTKTCEKLEIKGAACVGKRGVQKEDSDEECINGYGCNNKVCTEILSLENGVAVVAANARFCKTHFVEGGKCVDAKFDSASDQCPEDVAKQVGFCKYSYLAKPEDKKRTEFTRDCACGPNSSTAKYCPMANQNSKWQTYIKDMGAWRKTGNGNTVHTSARNIFPGSMYKAELQTIDAPTYREMDSCYWSVKSGNFLAAGLAGFFAIVALLM
jgi:hypothetical protein